MNPFNINVIGPGAWYMLHLLAANAKTDDDIKGVHYAIETIANNFFCLRCRKHFTENREKFVPPNVNKYNELFIWTVEMHNRVNDLNGKPRISHREALSFYINGEAVCQGDCGAEEKATISCHFIDVLSKGDACKFETVVHRYGL